MWVEFNRATYKAARVAVRLFLGKARRDAFMQRFWPDSYDFPKPFFNLVPFRLRLRLAQDYAIKSMKGTWAEPNIMNFISRIRGKVFVDVGANFGLYCVKLAKNFDRIIAIEADPVICERLSEICPPNCEAVNVVVSDVEGDVRFYRKLPRVDSSCDVKGLAWSLTLGSIFPAGQEWARDARTEREMALPAAPLSKILENEREIDLVKVDVEGAEWQVLKGAEAIMPQIKRWVIELHELSRGAELEDLMKQYGYDKNEWLDSTHLASHRSTQLVTGKLTR